MNETHKVESRVAVAALALLLLACLVVLLPFISAILWAGIICYSSWPLYQRLVKGLRGRRMTAAALMVAGFSVILVVPFALVAANVAQGISEGAAWVQAASNQPSHPPPAWVENIPVAGPALAAKWHGWSGDMQKTMSQVETLLVNSTPWLIRQGVALTKGVGQLALSLLIAFFFFTGGEKVAAFAEGAGQKIGGEQVQRLARIAGTTVRSTVHGVLGTALVQGAAAAVGYAIAGLPSVFLLGLLTFFAAVVPIVGTALIWVPAALWLFLDGQTGMSLFLVLWGAIVVSGVDTLLKPYLMSKGARQPFVLILLGVMGGLIAFGFIGVFIGPTLLAVGMALAREWVSARSSDKNNAAGGAVSEPGARAP